MPRAPVEHDVSLPPVPALPPVTGLIGEPGLLRTPGLAGAGAGHVVAGAVVAGVLGALGVPLTCGGDTLGAPLPAD